MIVEHRANGKMKLHQPSLAGLGAASGALWGGLIGLIFLMPLLGMAVGAASGAAGGAMSDYGIDDNFMKELGNKLPEGGAAVFVLVKDATRDKVVPEIAKYGGQVIQSSLEDEAEASLQEALDNRGTLRVPSVSAGWPGPAGGRAAADSGPSPAWGSRRASGCAGARRARGGRGSSGSRCGRSRCSRRSRCGPGARA